VATDRDKTDRVTTDEGEAIAVAEFRPLVRKILETGRKGSHEIIISVDDRGKPKLLVRGAHVPPDRYNPG
jgi:hypothetical protein